jgi:hypothetical protein
MHLSLWQQFSSNHSARFSIVGIFASTDAAKNAHTEVSALLHTIDTWHSEHFEESEELWDSGELTPVEQEFSQKHNIEWDNIWWEGYRTDVYKQIVLISSAGQVDSGAYPINKLLEKLGAEVLVDGDIHRDFISGKLDFDIYVEAPTQAIAAEVAALTGGEQINSTVRIHLDEPRAWKMKSTAWGGLSVGEALIQMLKLIEDKKCTIHYFGSTQKRGHFINRDE